MALDLTQSGVFFCPDCGNLLSLPSSGPITCGVCSYETTFSKLPGASLPLVTLSEARPTPTWVEKWRAKRAAEESKRDKRRRRKKSAGGQVLLDGGKDVGDNDNEDDDDDDDDDDDGSDDDESDDEDLSDVDSDGDSDDDRASKSKEKVRATIEEPCPECNHPRVEFYTMQLRSADEGATVFYDCPNCGHKWSQNN